MLDLARLYDFCAQVTIQGKDGGFTQLETLYGTQRYFFEQIAKGLEEGIHEFVVLKGRQEGISTACDVLDLYYPQTVTGLNGMLVSDEDENRDYRRDLIRGMHASLPNDYKWPLRMDNSGALAWAPPNGSRLMFAAAGRREARPGKARLGKSKGINYLHADEVAAWRDLGAVGKLRASMSKQHPRRLYVWNSTAEGHGTFKRMFKTAEGATTQRALFVGWWLHESYSIPRTNTKVWDRYGWDLTRAELDWLSEVKRRFGVVVTPEHVVYWRWSLAEEFSNDEALALQEMPHLPEHAFQSFGDRYIPVGTITHLRAVADKAPAATGYDYEWPEDKNFIENLEVVETAASVGELLVWEEPDPAGVYVVAAHPARSSDPDAALNVCYVLRAYRETLVQVAEFVSEDVEMYRFAWACMHLAGAYRQRVPCFFICELQMTGEYVWQELQRMADYGRGFMLRPSKELIAVTRPWTSIVNYVYRRSDQLGGTAGALHMRTSIQQRAWLMTGMKNEVEKKNVVLYSGPLIDELSRLRRGEAGDNDEVSSGGDEEEQVGRVHALALGVEAWLKSAMPSVYKLVPSQQPTPPDAQTVGHNLVASFLRQRVLTPPKKIRTRVVGGQMRPRP